MSVLDVLAGLPGINSLKRAQNILDELRAKGWRVVPTATPQTEAVVAAEWKAHLERLRREREYARAIVGAPPAPVDEIDI